MIRRTRPQALRAAAAGAVVLGAVSLSGCGGTDDAAESVDHEPTTAATTSAATAAATSGATPSPEVTGGTDADGTLPPWARPLVVKGTKLTTVKAGAVSVDVYQVGTETASKSGQFVDPATNKPIIAEGDPLVFVNYVVKNTGTEPIALGFSLVDVSPRYDDWKYVQGMDSVVDQTLFEKVGINSDALDPGKGPHKAPFTLAPG